MSFRLLAVTAAALALLAAGCNQSDGGKRRGAAISRPRPGRTRATRRLRRRSTRTAVLPRPPRPRAWIRRSQDPSPYTVLVPRDEAFAKVEGALKDPANPQNRAELTRILTYTSCRARS